MIAIAMLMKKERALGSGLTLGGWGECGAVQRIENKAFLGWKCIKIKAFHSLSNSTCQAGWNFQRKCRISSNVKGIGLTMFVVKLVQTD